MSKTQNIEKTFSHHKNPIKTWEWCLDGRTIAIKTEKTHKFKMRILIINIKPVA